MCGRTACTLDKTGIQCATNQYSRNEKTLRWIQKYDWQNYQPNYNLSPSQISPVLISDDLLSPQERINDYAIMPMRWGLIPSWYKGSMEKYGCKTNNCRIENIMEKPTYRGAASSGLRCVILADGFYEWKSIGRNRKQPYFIYFPQVKGSDVFTQKFDSNDTSSWCGPRLLTIAGLFDIWKNPQNDIIYSYSVITMDSSKTVSFVHERMPAILDGKDQVSMWLDSKRVPIKAALANLKPVEELQMHPVSTVVNYSKNNSVDCLIKKEAELPAVIKRTALTAWLQKEKKASGSPAKRLKSDFDDK